MGASIMQMSRKFFTVSNPSTSLNEKLKGDNHKTAVFEIGLSLEYDFFDNFNIPIRTELDFTSRENTDYSYTKFYEVPTIGSLKSTVKNQIKLNTLMLSA